MRQDLHNRLTGNGMKNLELPVQNMNLVSAFNDKAMKSDNTGDVDLEVRRSNSRSSIS
jgi:hypothetical protein